jgi:hypothetical protein
VNERKAVEYGWIAPLTLLLFLSVLPLLLPKADAIPEDTPASADRVAARPHARVVLIIVDGLGYGKAVNRAYMPLFVERIKTSAFGMGLASFPTITPSGLRAILSGHHMSAEPQLPTGVETPAETDSVMSRAVAAGLKVFAVGQFTWPPLFPDGHGAHLTLIPYSGISIHFDHQEQESISRYDTQVLHAAEPVLRGAMGPWDLLILHLFESDPIAHAIGTQQPIYRNHLRLVDIKIDELSKRLQAEAPTAFVMLADHGQADDGSHGGMTRVERQVPFMMWGAGIKAGKLGTFPLYNAAPTVTALLGVPPPAQTEGWPMVAGFLMSNRQKADIMLDLLHQRMARWRTLLAAWPWIDEKKLERVDTLEHLYALKKYDIAARAIELHIRGADKVIENSMPEKWLWRLIAALWLLVLAACFGLAWHEVVPRIRTAACCLAAACLLFVALPLLWSGAWGWASDLVLVCSLLLLILTLVPGLRGVNGLETYGWLLLWFSMLGIAFQTILDVSLWSWLVLLGLFVGRALHLTRRNRATTLMSLAAAMACALLACGRQSTESSLARSLLPSFYAAFAAAPNWPLLDLLFMLSVMSVGYLYFVRWNVEGRRWLLFVSALSPLAISFVVAFWSPSAIHMVWLACVLSLAAYLTLRPPASLRGIWLSALALAYYRTLTADASWGFLALTVLTGWGLAWESRDAHPLWEGLGLLGIGLWSYKCLGGDLSFSQISVEEGFRTLGGGWHPSLVICLIVLKQIAAISAPILPRLASRSLNSVLGIMPLVGAFSAGNLTLIWWDRFQIAGNEKIGDHVEFARVVFGLILSWLILALWLEIQAMDRLSLRLFNNGRAEAG